MSELTEFLLARIAEDEAAAKASGSGTWSVECPYASDPHLRDELAEHLAGPFHADECVITGTCGLRIYDEGGHTPADAQHIARHDPARVLAECEAKRRIVELHALTSKREREWTYLDQGEGPKLEQFADSIYCAACGQIGYIEHSWQQASDPHPEVPDTPCPTLLALAVSYADHPDYREEWRP